ncbi:MAG: hypothetical protein ABL876_19585, partial [Chitinophagaceae bacterium]
MSDNVYKMQWKDAEEQSWLVKMFDQSGGGNPYNINVFTQQIGGGLRQVRFFFSNIPASATDTTIGYSSDNGATWTDASAGLASPATITVPDGIEYVYRFIVNYADPLLDETFLIEELGVTEYLTPTGHPLDIFVVNNDPDKFQTIKAKQAVLRFHSNRSINLATFRKGEKWDDRFYVEIYKNSRIVMKGYPILDDMSEPFLDKRNEVNITMTDRLGTLKERELKDFDGTVPMNEKRLATIVAMALGKTGMNLPINVVSNLREEHCFRIGNCTFYAATSRITISDTNADGFFIAGHSYRFSGSAANNTNYLVTAVNTPFSWLTELIVSTPVVDEVNANCTIEDLTNAGN